jgi:integrase
MPRSFNRSTDFSSNYFDHVVKRLLDNTLSPSSHASYTSGYKLFSRFAAMFGYDVSRSSFLSPVLLLRFIAFCHGVRRIQSGSIRSYLAAIRFYRLKAGFKDPFLDLRGAVIPQIHMALRGSRRLHRKTPKQCKPITIDVLSQLVARLQRGVFNPYDDVLMHTALTTAFWGFFRSGELFPTRFHPFFHVTCADVVVHRDRSTIHLKSSKTDHERKGVDVHLFRTSPSVCAVRALRKFIPLRPSTSVDSSFFCTRAGQPFTRTCFVKKLKYLLRLIGIDATSFSGHSLRVGAATSAAAAGIPDHQIQTLGRWTSLSYLRYIRCDRSVLRNAHLKISSFESC